MVKGKKKEDKLEKVVNEENLANEKNLSFVDKIKTDKKYSAKVQLLGYGVLIVALVLYINISGMSNSTSVGNNITSNNLTEGLVEESTSNDKKTLLEQLDNNNYNYDVNVEVEKKNSTDADDDVSDEVKVRYYGSVYEDSVSINREDTSGSYLYYKVDDRYYSKNDTEMKLQDEEDIYSLIDGEYIEIASILKLLDKASLDHVTDYSSGKKEYVYHLKVRDVVVSYKMEDVVEIEIEEENNVLKIDIDYSNLLKVVDESIISCELEAVVTDILNVEAFLDLEVDTKEE